MAKPQSKFRTCLFGVNKQQVDSYIAHNKDSYSKSLDEVKDNIREIMIENDRLIKEIEMLKEMGERKTQPEELMIYALEKADDFFEEMNHTASKKIDEIMQEGRNKEEEFNLQIKEIDKEIKNNQEYLDSILSNEVQKKVKSNEDTNNIANKASSREEAVIKEAIKDMPERVSDTGNVSDLKDTFEKVLKDEDEFNIFLGEDETNNSSVYSVVKFSEDEFEIDDYSIEDLMPSNFNISKVSNPEKLEADIRQANEEIEPIKEEPVQVEGEKIETRPQVESKAIKGEINTLRYKYLVGKIAGEDLFDKMGNLIIAKKSFITEEIVNKAEKEGKLSELIINMTLPEIVE